MSDALEEELESLSSIFDTQLNISRADCVVLSIAVPTCQITDANAIEAAVGAVLKITISPSSYPTPSKVVLQRPRGLSELDQDNLQSLFRRICEEGDGEAVLFELIQCASDFCTSLQCPSAECVICLLQFTPADDWLTLRACGHILHAQCLGRYLLNFCCVDPDELEPEAGPACPTCRCPIEEINELDVYNLIDSADPVLTNTINTSAIPSVTQSDHLKELYDRQLRNGGIISVEQNNKRLLVTEDTRLPTPDPDESSGSTVAPPCEPIEQQDPEPRHADETASTSEAAPENTQTERGMRTERCGNRGRWSSNSRAHGSSRARGRCFDGRNTDGRRLEEPAIRARTDRRIRENYRFGGESQDSQRSGASKGGFDAYRFMRGGNGDGRGGRRSCMNRPPRRTAPISRNGAFQSEQLWKSEHNDINEPPTVNAPTVCPAPHDSEPPPGFDARPVAAELGPRIRSSKPENQPQQSPSRGRGSYRKSRGVTTNRGFCRSGDVRNSGV